MFKSLCESLLNLKEDRSHAKYKHKYIIRRKLLNNVNLRIFCNKIYTLQ